MMHEAFNQLTNFERSLNIESKQTLDLKLATSLGKRRGEMLPFCNEHNPQP